MTRDTGQIGGRSLTLGLLAAVAVMAGMVGLVGALRPSARPVAEPVGAEAPDVVDAVDECEDLPDRLDGQLVTSTSLVTCPDDYDGVDVRITGEVVGAVLQRGAESWVQLNDDVYGLSIGPLPEHGQTQGANTGVQVVVPTAVAREIVFVGSRRASGDVLSIEGTFLATDPGDGGSPTIRAQTVQTVQEGRLVERPVQLLRYPAAALALLLAVAVTVRARRERRDP